MDMLFPRRSMIYQLMTFSVVPCYRPNAIVMIYILTIRQSNIEVSLLTMAFRR